MRKHIDIRIWLEDDDESGYFDIVEAIRTDTDLPEGDLQGLGEVLTQGDWGQINFLHGIIETIYDGRTDFEY